MSPCVMLFHAAWSRPSCLAKERLEAAVTALAPPSPFAPPNPVRCVIVDLSTFEGEEAGLVFKVRVPGALQCFIGGRRVLTISATGIVNAGMMTVDSGSVEVPTAALVVLGSLQHIHAPEADIARLFMSVLKEIPAASARRGTV